MSLKTMFNTELYESLRLYWYYFLPATFISYYLINKVRYATKYRLPPGPMGLPLVGYLPFLGKEPFRTLDDLRKKYGNVFSLYLGRTPIVILGDYTAVKEGLSKATTLARPDRIFDFLPDGGGLTGVNGEEWVEQRRFTVKSMKDLGLGRSTFGNLVEDELLDVLKDLQSKDGRPIDIGQILTPSVSNNISALVFGKRLPPGPDRDFLNLMIDKVPLFFAQSGLWNFYPKIVDILVKLRIGSYYKAFLEMKALNIFMRKEVDMHKGSHKDSTGADFVNDYIEEMQGQGEKTTFTERNLIGNTQALYLAGSETTRTSLTWLILAMTLYPDVQQKVRNEIESVLEKNQKATWEDRLKFPYTYAVITEAQRWMTIVPINLARITTEDIKISGYDIPKGTTILSNIWSLHNDPKYWDKPNEFKPERFLQNGGKEVNLKLPSYIPFSYGKRKCPGETVALMEIFLYFTAFIQQFEIKTPNGGKPKMGASLGITYQPLPQNLCFVPLRTKS